MAFVSQSPRRTLAPIQSAANNLGPGDYTSDLNLLSKSASLQRKQPAFGFGEERKLGKTNDTNQITPGPGAYLSHNDLVNAVYDKKLDDHTSYIVKDNGHVNQRTQQYAHQTTRDSSLQVLNKNETPGPGSYQINTSSFGTHQPNINHIKPFTLAANSLKKKNSVNGLNLAANLSSKMATLSGYLNLSIPSIPSRYIQPNLDLDENEILKIEQDGVPILNHQDNTLIAGKVKIIANDKSRLGPGTYQVSESLLKKSPRANVNFGISKTMRTADDSFVKKTTINTVGPGSYEIMSSGTGLERKIFNPTIPRDGVNNSMFAMRKKQRNNGSIRDNFEVDSDSEDEQEKIKRQKQLSPGPGQYLKDEHINTLGKDSLRPQQFQFFGSSIERFKVPVSCTHGIGPGAYNTDKNASSTNERNKHFQFAGSSSFMGIARHKNNLMLNKTRLEIPGPGDYKAEESLQHLNESKIRGSKQAFNSNIDRFKVHDEKVPGPGKYPVPGSMNIRSATQVHASFRSAVKKELVFPIDKDIPGTGVYNPQDYKQIGIQKITGGAPNNFSLLAKKTLSNNQRMNYQTPDKEILNVSPRGIINDISTPAALGPGYYGGTKFKILDNQPKLVQDSKMFGRGDRFPDPKSPSPGPGAYSDLNKWHQKTYNLKFLNVQMSPQVSNTPSAL